MNPNICHVDVSVLQPHGVSHCTNLRDMTREQSDIVDIVQAYCAPSHNISDVAEPLCFALQARFPKSGLSISLTPDIYSRFKLHGLKSADCKISIPHILPKSGYWNPFPHLEVATNWHLPITTGSTAQPANILLETREHMTSDIGDRNTDARQAPRRSLAKPLNVRRTDLGQAHPTFYVHQELVRLATASQGIAGENAALRIALLAFDAADKQYNDERLERVSVGMRYPPSNPQEPRQALQIHISRIQYEQFRSSMSDGSLRSGWQKTYIALGSNIGDRISMIESACREMKNRGLNVTRTSALYETKAMYFENQQSFVNGACEVSRVQGPLRHVVTSFP